MSAIAIIALYLPLSLAVADQFGVATGLALFLALGELLARIVEYET